MHEQLTDQAGKIGTEHGRNAAGWVFDGSTPAETYASVVRMLDDGDPEVYDAYRVPDLSGEFSDDYTSQDLAADLDISWNNGFDPVEFSDYEQAYLDAASCEFWDEVERIARYHTRES
jgi:hypothetical protein